MLLRLGSLALLLYTVGRIRSAMPTLPPRIPTHFNAAGHVDGWGSPTLLWNLFWIQLALTALFFALPLISAMFPNLGHIGRHRMSEFSGAQRAEIARVVRRIFDITALMMNGIFAYICRGTIEAARTPGAALPPWPMFLMMGGAVAGALYGAFKLMQFEPATADGTLGIGAARNGSAPPPIE